MTVIYVSDWLRRFHHQYPDAYTCCIGIEAIDSVLLEGLVLICNIRAAWLGLSNVSICRWALAVLMWPIANLKQDDPSVASVSDKCL